MQDKVQDKIRVGILRGGQGDHYESSLKRGGHILSHIFENLSHKFKPIDILVDSQGVWHKMGLPIKPADLIHKVDIVWNAGHPAISNVLKSLSIPSISESPFHSLLKDNRVMLKEHLKNDVLKIPKHIILPVYQEDIDGQENMYAAKKAKEVFGKFSSPWVVRSFSHDANVVVHVANSFEELVNAIGDVSSYGQSILVEELITGKSVSVHSVTGFRGEELYTFPVSGFSTLEKENLVNLSKKLFESHFSDSHYAKFDFIVHKNKGIFLINVDFYPDLRGDSSFSASCESVGAKMHHVVENMLEQALK